MIAEIEEAFARDEYSGAATYDIDSINFIDTVNESLLTQQLTAHMPCNLRNILITLLLMKINNF